MWKGDNLRLPLSLPSERISSHFDGLRPNRRKLHDGSSIVRLRLTIHGWSWLISDCPKLRGFEIYRIPTRISIPNYWCTFDSDCLASKVETEQLLDNDDGYLSSISLVQAADNSAHPLTRCHHWYFTIVKRCETCTVSANVMKMKHCNAYVWVKVESFKLDVHRNKSKTVKQWGSLHAFHFPTVNSLDSETWDSLGQRQSYQEGGT